MRTAIIIPTYNERENLPKIVAAIFKLAIENLSILVVDDNSPDGTSEIADALAAKYSSSAEARLAASLRVIHRPGKLGLGSAYVAGFKKALQAGADLIFEMDADFSHNPADIPRLLGAAQAGADVVIGSRRVTGGNVTGWNWRRNLQSLAAMTLARLILNLKTRDITAGFRCYRRRVLESINLDDIKSNGYAFQEEMIYLAEKKKFKISEVPVTFVDRQAGKSKLGIRDIWEFFITVFRLKFRDEI